MSKKILPGIYEFLEKGKKYKRYRLAILTHQAAILNDYTYTFQALLREGFSFEYIFVPEHGFFSEEQDQVPVKDSELNGIRVVSLYGDRLFPDEEVLNEIDGVIIDLVDIGVRYYTYVWTALLVLKTLNRTGKFAIVLDRPNPYGGRIEGPVLDRELFSFVGLLPVPVLHGMTIGELLLMGKWYWNIDIEIEVFKVNNWHRAEDIFTSRKKFVFVPPSPNMPYPETILVYPGMCLLEATNISEGRGTTRPFEIFGAPFIEPFEFVKFLKPIPGAIVRPYYFIPTFHKYKGQKIGGGFLHILDVKKFNSFGAALHILKTIKLLYPESFQFLLPPYEYEEREMPFDILTGHRWIRERLEKENWLDTNIFEKEIEEFKDLREDFLLYA